MKNMDALEAKLDAMLGVKEEEEDAEPIRVLPIQKVRALTRKYGALFGDRTMTDKEIGQQIASEALGQFRGDARQDLKEALENAGDNYREILAEHPCREGQVFDHDEED